MTVLYVILIVLAILLWLLYLNIHVILRYEESASVTVRILCFRFDAIRLFQKWTDSKEENQTSSPKKKDKAEKKSQKKKGDLPGFIEFLWRIAKIIALAVKEHFAKMKVNLKMLSVEIATDDAARTALLAGGAIQAANVLCELLRRFSNFRCDNRHLSIGPNFTSGQSRFVIHLVLTMKPIHLIGLAVRSYMRFFEGKEDHYERNTTQTGH